MFRNLCLDISSCNSCVGLTLILTLKPSAAANPAALYWEMAFLVFAIVFFELATEFYIAAAWKSQTIIEYEELALKGSVPYSLAMAVLAVSIGMMFLALTNVTILAYLPPVLFLVSWGALFIIRSKAEPNLATRWIVRAIMVLILIAGIILMIVLSCVCAPAYPPKKIVRKD